MQNCRQTSKTDFKKKIFFANCLIFSEFKYSFLLFKKNCQSLCLHTCMRSWILIWLHSIYSVELNIPETLLTLFICQHQAGFPWGHTANATNSTAHSQHTTDWKWVKRKRWGERFKKCREKLVDGRKRVMKRQTGTARADEEQADSSKWMEWAVMVPCGCK